MALVACPTFGFWNADDPHTSEVKSAIGDVDLALVNVTVIESVAHQLGVLSTPIFLFELETSYRSGHSNREEQGFQVIRTENDFKALRASLLSAFDASIVPPLPRVDRLAVSYYDRAQIIESLKTDAMHFTECLCAHQEMRKHEEVIAFLLLGQSEWETHWRKHNPYIVDLNNLAVLVRPEVGLAEATQLVRDMLSKEIPWSDTFVQEHQLRLEGTLQADLERHCSFVSDVNRSLVLLLERTSTLIRSEQPTASEAAPKNRLQIFLDESSALCVRRTSATGPTEDAMLSALTKVFNESRKMEIAESDDEATFETRAAFSNVGREFSKERHRALLALYFEATRAQRWCDAALDVFRHGSSKLQAIVSATQAHEDAKLSLVNRAEHELELEKAERKLATYNTAEAGYVEGFVLIGRTYFHGCAINLTSTENKCADLKTEREGARVEYSKWQESALTDVDPFTKGLAATVERITLRWLELEKTHAFDRAEKFSLLLGDLERLKREQSGVPSPDIREETFQESIQAHEQPVAMPPTVLAGDEESNANGIAEPDRDTEGTPDEETAAKAAAKKAASASETTRGCQPVEAASDMEKPPIEAVRNGNKRTSMPNRYEEPQATFYERIMSTTSHEAQDSRVFF